jgi:transposase
LDWDVKMDGYIDGSKDGFVGRLEVIEGRGGRRRWSDAEKARIASESFRPGARVAEVARRHGTTRWQIYDWRKRLRRGLLPMPVGDSPAFASVVIASENRPSVSMQKKDDTQADVVEVVIEGVVIRAGSGIEEAHLARVIRAVRAALR